MLSPLTAAVCRCTAALTLVAALSGPEVASADPFDLVTFAVRANTYVTITTFTGVGIPPFDRVEDITNVDEIFDVDDLALIDSSLTGSGAATGYSGSGSARITDAVLGVYATVTSADVDAVNINSNGYAGFIDYFTVQLPEGALVPMLFTLAPSYTLQATGGACGLLLAYVQVGGGGGEYPFVGSLSYREDSCGPDAFLAMTQLMVPTGVPFRVLYELSASASAGMGVGGSATVDARNSLDLFADPVGSFNYSTASGQTYLSTPTPVPEPASVLLLGAGLAAIGVRYRRRPKP